jgi:hypothetical protein
VQRLFSSLMDLTDDAHSYGMSGKGLHDFDLHPKPGVQCYVHQFQRFSAKKLADAMILFLHYSAVFRVKNAIFLA